jgi:predicted ArsR family transcriptional regulator
LVLLKVLNGLRALGVDDATAWQLVAKAALDSMPAIRRTVLEVLRNQTSATTQALASKMGYPNTTTRRALEDLAAHGVVQCFAMGAGKADLWSVSQWTAERWPETNEEAFPKSHTA